MDKLTSIIGIIIIYGLINLALWGSQELYWRKDTQEINKIESYLKDEYGNINSLEIKINNESLSLDAKQKELDRLKNDEMFDEYNLQVDNYNFLLKEYKSDVDSYNDKLIKYNQEVERSNELITKSSSRWYLIPIPIPGKSLKSKI